MENERQLVHERGDSNALTQSGPRRWRTTSVSVYFIVALLALSGMGLTILAIEIQSAVRAYVAAESQWSKSQKEVVYWLDRYASTGEAGWLAQARQALDVPSDDLRARLAMEGEPPDRELAKEYFIAAGNHPDDASRMVWLFMHFRDAPNIRDAVAHWRDSDVHIRRLQEIADEMEVHFRTDRENTDVIRDLRNEVSRIAETVRPLQDGFSAALGRGSRWLDSWLKGSAIVAFGALAIVIAFIFRWATRRIGESERQFRDTFEQAAMGMAQMQSDGTLVAVNAALSGLLGYPRDALVGKSLSEFLHHDEDPDSLRQLMAIHKTPHTQEYKLRTREGGAIWCRFSLSRVNDAWGGQHHLILGVQDVTETQDLMHKLHYQASHDALTDTINRYEFEEQLSVVVHHALDHGAQHALCFIDLDQFKVVNDTAGHLAGDEVLQEVSRLLRRELRRTDVLARLGGDEFGVILRDCDERVAIEVAEKLREAIDGYVFYSGDTQLRIGASVGCVSIDASTPDPTELLRAADTACYMAKDYGRNRVILYSPDDEALQSRHSEMAAITRIRTALSEDRFILYAQEIRPLVGGEPSSCEVLVRMLDPDGHLVSPSQFLPAAERYNVAPDIDRWVVQASLDALARHPQQLERMGLCHINLSGQSIGRDDFLGFLERTLDQSPVEPSKLCFEITETAAISNLADARHFFERLGQRGCAFALDDFGSGLSSFGYLTSFPVDFVKIDGVFVLDVLENEVNRTIVKSISEIVSLMGKSVVAECIETDAVRDTMAELGVKWGQGYGIHRPCPMEDFLGSFGKTGPTTGG